MKTPSRAHTLQSAKHNSAYRISHEEWNDLREILIDKRNEFGFAWGKGI